VEDVDVGGVVVVVVVVVEVAVEVVVGRGVEAVVVETVTENNENT
jgi:hypothetical protein